MTHKHKKKHPIYEALKQIRSTLEQMQSLLMTIAVHYNNKGVD